MGHQAAATGPLVAVLQLLQAHLVQGRPLVWLQTAALLQMAQQQGPVGQAQRQGQQLLVAPAAVGQVEQGVQVPPRRLQPRVKEQAAGLAWWGWMPRKLGRRWRTP